MQEKKPSQLDSIGEVNTSEKITTLTSNDLSTFSLFDSPQQDIDFNYIPTPNVITNTYISYGGDSGSVGGVITSGAIGATGPTGSVSGYNLNWSSSYAPSVNITTQGISMPSDADIRIGEVSLKDFISKIEQRLAILVPDPKKLEKYKALKIAYENYKVLEKLCEEDTKTDQL